MNRFWQNASAISRLSRAVRQPGESKRWSAVFGLLLLIGCHGEPSVQTIDVSLQAGQLYEYPTVSGDEEGARLILQARHFAVSEIRRNAETNWAAVYAYRPLPGYSGPDRAEIEVLIGSDGASPPKRVTRLVFRFDVQD